eukprot:scaffold107855_cov20-Tisochrysis_lutea.AAC.1
MPASMSGLHLLACFSGDFTIACLCIGELQAVTAQQQLRAWGRQRGYLQNRHTANWSHAKYVRLA